MARVTPASPRYLVLNDGLELRVIIPEVFHPLVFLAMLVGWIVVLYCMMSSLFTLDLTGIGWDPLLIGMILLTTLLPSGLLVSMQCREVIVLNERSLIDRWEIWGLGHSREFDLRLVQNLRCCGSALAFEFGARTFHLAWAPNTLFEVEAKLLLEELNRHGALLQAPGMVGPNVSPDAAERFHPMEQACPSLHEARSRKTQLQSMPRPQHSLRLPPTDSIQG